MNEISKQAEAPGGVCFLSSNTEIVMLNSNAHFPRREGDQVKASYE